MTDMILANPVAAYGNAFQSGMQQADATSQMAQRNALRDLYRTQGPGIMSGDPAAMNAFAQLDPAAAMEIGLEEVGEDPVELPIKDAVHFALGDAAYKPRDLKTVAQLEKQLAKKAPLLWAALQEHITQADGKPGIARMEDPRPPLVNVGHEFPVAEASSAAAGLL